MPTPLTVSEPLNDYRVTFTFILVMGIIISVVSKMGLAFILFITLNENNVRYISSIYKSPTRSKYMCIS